MTTTLRTVALVAARDEEGRIGPCVRALRDVVTEVVVVDDASSDATPAEANDAGATVLRVERRLGKGAALEGALRRLERPDLWLLADGDLGETAEGLSGQRALTAAAMDAVRPLADGFGVETAMTIDAVRAGLRVIELPIDGLDHRPTYRDPAGFVHRARQGWDIARAVAPRVWR